MFLNHLYGGMDEPELKIIDVFVCKLRKKLATATNGEHYIETACGRGYVLRDPSPREVMPAQRFPMSQRPLRRSGFCGTVPHLSTPEAANISTPDRTGPHPYV